MERDEDDLVGGAQRGDRQALDSLLRAHVDRIHALCRRMTGNEADAADATQEALLAIVRGLPRFDGRSSFGTWAYRVTTNACLDELRKRKRRPDPAADEILAASSGSASLPPDTATKVDVDRALLRLPVEFRSAVVLRDLSGFDYSEIAEILGLPVGTVKSRIARGRGMLADLLAGNSEPSPERPRDDHG